MIISHSHRFIFIKTKKTAGTSIELALSPHLKVGDLASPLGNLLPRHRLFSKPFVSLLRQKDQAIRARNDHLPFSVIDKYFREETQGYFAFCVERNPWDKAVSAFYYWTSKHGKNASKTDVENFLDFTASQRLSYFSDYEKYMQGDRQQVDRVLRYERLSNDFAEVMADLSLPQITLDEITANTQQRPKTAQRLEAFYGVNFDNTAASNVRKVFAREIEYFQWEPTPLPGS